MLLWALTITAIPQITLKLRKLFGCSFIHWMTFLRRGRACAQQQLVSEPSCRGSRLPPGSKPSGCHKVDNMRASCRPLTRCTPIHLKGLHRFRGLVCTQVTRSPYFLFRLIEQLSKQGWLHPSPAGQKLPSYSRIYKASWKEVLVWISDLLFLSLCFQFQDGTIQYMGREITTAVWVPVRSVEWNKTRGITGHCDGITALCMFTKKKNIF